MSKKHCKTSRALMGTPDGWKGSMSFSMAGVSGSLVDEISRDLLFPRSPKVILPEPKPELKVMTHNGYHYNLIVDEQGKPRIHGARRASQLFIDEVAFDDSREGWAESVEAASALERRWEVPSERRIKLERLKKNWDLHVRAAVQAFADGQPYGSRATVLWARGRTLWLEKKYNRDRIRVTVRTHSGVLLVEDPRVQEQPTVKPGYNPVGQYGMGATTGSMWASHAGWGPALQDAEIRGDHTTHFGLLDKVYPLLDLLEAPYLKVRTIPGSDAACEELVLLKVTKGMW